MKIRFEPFAFEDLLELQHRGRDAAAAEVILRNQIEARIRMAGPGASAITAWTESGRPVACFGVSWPGSAPIPVAWAVLSEQARAVILPITRAARRLLENYSRAHRMAIFAEARDAPARRWLAVLGFVQDPENDEWWFA